jgi:probable rRNA maturation factor
MVRPRIEIAVQNRERKTRLSASRLAGWVEKILKFLGWRRVGLSLVVVSDSEMRHFNHRFLGEDRPTDVLAFGRAGGKFFDRGKTPFLGDVIVSVETARRVAPEFGNRWDEELLLYVCHGILHLMGYRDSTSRKKAQMDRKQKQILQKVLGGRWPSGKPKPLF